MQAVLIDSIIISADPSKAMPALVATKNPDAALLYAFAVSSGGKCTMEQAKTALEMTEKRVLSAMLTLCTNNIAHTGCAPPPEQEISYHPSELARAREGDSVFTGLCNVMERALGRTMRKSELETLYSVYDKLNMPAEVLSLMVFHCSAQGRLSARELERRAYKWHDLGISDIEKATVQMTLEQSGSSKHGRVLSIFGISGRMPSETEKKYIDSWLSMSFSDKMLKLAYDKMVLRIGKLNFKYMDSILKSWHEQGFTTPREVEQGDKPGAKRQNAKPAESTESAVLSEFEQRRKRRELQQRERMLQFSEMCPEFIELQRELGRCNSRMARASGDGRVELAEQRAQLTARRTQLLAVHGKNEAWLFPPPDCILCGDTGYKGAQRCKCLATAIAQKEG